MEEVSDKVVFMSTWPGSQSYIRQIWFKIFSRQGAKAQSLGIKQIRKNSDLTLDWADRTGQASRCSTNSKCRPEDSPGKAYRLFIISSVERQQPGRYLTFHQRRERNPESQRRDIVSGLKSRKGKTFERDVLPMEICDGLSRYTAAKIFHHLLQRLSRCQQVQNDLQLNPGIFKRRPTTTNPRRRHDILAERIVFIGLPLHHFTD